MTDPATAALELEACPDGWHVTIVELAVRAALEGLRAEVAKDDEPYLSAEWLLTLIDARLAALDE